MTHMGQHLLAEWRNNKEREKISSTYYDSGIFFFFYLKKLVSKNKCVSEWIYGERELVRQKGTCIASGL